MQIGPELPSEELSDYLHPDAAAVYPTISSTIKNDIDPAGHAYINEMNDNLEGRRDVVDEFIKSSSEIMNIVDRSKKSTIKKAKLEAVWLCEVCDETISVGIDYKSDELESIDQRHCNQQMQISVVPVVQSDFHHDAFEEYRRKYIKAKKSDDYESAGLALLDSIIQNLVMRPNLFDSTTFIDLVKELKIENNPITKTWGFNTSLTLAQSFTKIQELDQIEFSNGYLHSSKMNSLGSQLSNIPLYC